MRVRAVLCVDPDGEVVHGLEALVRELQQQARLACTHNTATGGGRQRATVRRRYTHSRRRRMRQRRAEQHGAQLWRQRRAAAASASADGSARTDSRVADDDVFEEICVRHVCLTAAVARVRTMDGGGGQAAGTAEAAAADRQTDRQTGGRRTDGHTHRQTAAIVHSALLLVERAPVRCSSSLCVAWVRRRPMLGVTTVTTPAPPVRLAAALHCHHCMALPCSALSLPPFVPPHRVCSSCVVGCVVVRWMWFEDR